MRLCRFGEDRLGLVTNENTVRDVTAALDVLPSWRYPLPSFDPLIAHLDRVSARVREIAPQSPDQPLDHNVLLSPIANPGKIIAAPVNYQKHLDEVRGDAQLHHGNQAHMAPIHTMGLFLKASSSLVGPSQGIRVRMPDRRTDHEVELAVIIGKQAKHLTEENAFSCVFGYTIGNDVSAREVQRNHGQWFKGKSYDKASPMGPWLVTADEVPADTQMDNLKAMVDVVVLVSVASCLNSALYTASRMLYSHSRSRPQCARSWFRRSVCPHRVPNG